MNKNIFETTEGIMFESFLETVKPISKDEALELFITDRKHKLNNMGWLQNKETENELLKVLSNMYDIAKTEKGHLFDLDQQKRITTPQNIIILECDVERLWNTMLGKYIWVGKDYILNNVTKDKESNTLNILFDDELTSIKAS